MEYLIKISGENGLLKSSERLRVRKLMLPPASSVNVFVYISAVFFAQKRKFREKWKMGKNSVQKVSAGWKKRVKIEYARLRHQKKFRHQDDIRVAWRGNRVAMQAGHIKKEVEQEKPLENENKEVIGFRAKPIWVCSEVSRLYSTVISLS